MPKQHTIAIYIYGGIARARAWLPRAMAIATVFALFAAPVPRLMAFTNQVIYTDSVLNGWEDDYSWATINDQNTSPVHTGTHSISVSSDNWEALYFHHAKQDSSVFTNLSFWINTGANTYPIELQATRNGNAQPGVDLGTLPANTWVQETISLPSLGINGVTDFDGFWLQVENSGIAPTFYVDDITLIGGTNPPPPPPPPSPAVTNAPGTITVDAALNRHPISPLIYGVAFADTGDLAALNSPMNRMGGNTTSRYNWTLNADNHAADYFFASLAEDSPVAGELADTFISQSRAGGAQPSITIPMVDWIAKLASTNRARLWSYSINKYGAQQKNDSKDGWPDMGNGARADGSLIITNDPNDANVPNSVAFEQGWLAHLTNTWGRATNGGVQYYHLDNEPALWDSTHQDVHPNGTSMGELLNKMTNYATMIKATDPGALIAGPEEWSIYGAIYSGADSQYEGANGFPGTFPDRTAHGGLDVYAYLLQQFALAGAAAGHRLLDVCTIHQYPQGGEFSDDVTLPTQLLRNRSTRSFWDTNYVDDSWLADNPATAIVAIIPRLHRWVATNYPGTLIGITEYNWGAETNINGATAQADILGIFGREGLDVGERWTTPPTGSFAYNAFVIYRNYDGHKATFGDTSVSASGPNPDLVSTFAAMRSSDGALTVMAINKQSNTNAPMAIALTNFPAAGTAQVWQLTSAGAITRGADIPFSGEVFSNMLPAQSITLFVIPVSVAPGLRVAGVTNDNFSFWLSGSNGQSYTVLSSTNLRTWTPLNTNVLTTNPLLLTLPATNSYRFYRAQTTP